ncbi:regulatory protein ArsR [Thermodesulfobium narugense DSM 14796]|uniref:Regulatory protein ArsR n=1 Tax=Thermodesulfobium narugense DSM 14796 TaxID=747365 RepID=M1E7B1_9BACT|nr:metalloregulator ArsR/SmtB family transcription factor [Thermodesulfobium narugense]AEE14573.1 regulatory protein ArsR [Thermodesulfobium narugense DSM 14796]
MEIIEIFKILSDETRFKIIELLLQNDYCVGALASKLNISSAAVSQHLQILRKAGIVKGEKRGYWTHYIVERNVIRKMAETLSKFADLPKNNKNFCSRESLDEKTPCKCDFKFSERKKQFKK